mmetsp:Transcript_3183/g.3826  ORF Transcript_3183/g.3826 Transcript_3183/m.3826 type:complete len:147 (-) Transcript_3183:1772-2212(-)
MDEPLLDEDEHNLNTNEGPWWLTGDEPPTTTTSVSRRINHWSDDDNNNPPFKAQQDREAEEIPDAVLYSMRIMNMVVAVALIISMVSFVKVLCSREEEYMCVCERENHERMNMMECISKNEKKITLGKYNGRHERHTEHGYKRYKL